MPIFPEISWDNVRSELIKYHKNFTSANVGQVIKMIITVSNTRLYNIYFIFCVIYYLSYFFF